MCVYIVYWLVSLSDVHMRNTGTCIPRTIKVLGLVFGVFAGLMNALKCRTLSATAW